MKKDNFVSKLDNVICFVAYRTSLHVRQYRTKEFKNYGYDITTEQWRVLHRIWEEDGLSQHEIAKRLFKQGPNITRILDDLEKDGLVIRKSTENNRRKYRLFLTEKGKAITGELRIIAKNVLKKACHGIDEKEIALAIDVLNRMYQNIEE